MLCLALRVGAEKIRGSNNSGPSGNRWLEQSYQWALASFIYHHVHKTMLLTFTLCGNLLGILLKMQVLFL